MRKLLLLFTVCGLLLLPLTKVLSQSLEDYVLEHRGDTLVVKDDIDFNGQNTLTECMNADTLDVPAGRVYMLHNLGYYSLVNNPTSSATQKTIIMGESNQSLKTNKDVNQGPPVVAGAVYEGGTSTGGISSGSDLLVKNISVQIANSAGGEGWAFFGFGGAGMRLQVDNCMIEHTLWAVVGGPPADETVIFTNDYFVNLDGHTCRRNGGVVDFNSGTTEDTLIVQNCTHVNTQGSLYKWRTGYTVKRSIINHNDFIDCSGYVFMNTGDHTDISITNNIFVNCVVQPFSPALGSADVGEVDPDLVPMGLVNVLNDSAFTANGATFYVDKNLVYWDPSLSDVVSTVVSNNVNGTTDWSSQMITMNERSQAMFDDDATYPKLTEGTWIKDVLPNFANTDVLFTDQLAVLKEFSIATVDTTYSGSLTSWRQPGNDEASYYTYSDWPIPIDLSYDNSDLMTAAIGGFPLGDLSWFPSQYTTWKAQEATELQTIHDALYSGTVAVEQIAALPTQYDLGQNYPNPFNPTTVIDFTIPKAGNAILKVYNALGQEVATLVNGYKNAANYKVNFDASNLSSGVYFYTLKVNNFTQTKKMLLLK